MPAQPDLNRHGGMHRSLDPIYAFPEKRFVKNLVDDMPHRTSTLRCLGGARNNFVLESFMEELGHAQSWDSLEYRFSQLLDPRAIAVLGHLEDCLGALPLAASLSRGIAYAQ